MNNVLIAQSERINVPLETKQDIVSTLQAYPLVLQELKVTEQALDLCNEIRQQDNLIIENKDKQITNLELQVKNVETQNTLLKKQIRRVRNKFIIGGGVLVGILILTK